MYSKDKKVTEDQIKAHVKSLSKDNVKAEALRNGKYRLTISRAYSRMYFGVEQKRPNTGLSILDSNGRIDKANADIIAGKITQMHNDLAYGNFDKSLVKYGLAEETQSESQFKLIDGGKKPQLSLLELWGKYLEYRKNDLAVTTFEKRYKRTFTNCIVEAVQKVGDDANDIRDYIVANRYLGTAKDVLSVLDQAYQWGMRRKYVNENLFAGMIKDLPKKVQPKEYNNNDSYNEDEDRRAFTIDEMNAIIEYFEITPTVSHWANYVKFLFWTGCRSGEIAALQWKHISPDCKEIRIGHSYDHQLRITKDTKTSVTTARFPCSQKLTNMLLTMKGKGVNPDDLVFTTREGKQVNRRNFLLNWTGTSGNSTRGYKGAIPELIKQGKVKQYLKCYATRHTYITILVEAGYDAFVIASWVRNSPDIIWKHYYQPTQKCEPYEF